MYQYQAGGQPPSYNNFLNTYYPQTAILNNEKATIRRAALFCGIPMIVLSIAMRFWSVPYLYIMQLFGFTQQKAVEIVSEPAVMQLLQIVLSSLLFIAPFAIAVSISGTKICKLIPFHAPQKGLWIPFIFIGVGVCSFANIGAGVVSSIFESFGFEYYFSYGDDPEGIFGFLLCLLSTAITPALVEEFACRGVIHGFLAKFGDGFAVIVTSIIFGVMHGNFTQIPFAFTVGIVLGFVRIKTGSVWICVVIHAINNFISLIFSWLPSSMSDTVQNMTYLLYVVISLMLTAVGFMMLKKWDGEFYKFNSPKSVCTEKQKYKWFFSSPAVIIFLILGILQAISYFFY